MMKPTGLIGGGDPCEKDQDIWTKDKGPHRLDGYMLCSLAHGRRRSIFNRSGRPLDTLRIDPSLSFVAFSLYEKNH